MQRWRQTEVGPEDPLSTAHR